MKKRKIQQKIEISFRLSDVSPSSKKLSGELGNYLAGLIEGDGSIIVPKKDKNLKGKKYHPIIRVVFNKNDLPLAEILQNKLNGFIQKPKTKAYILWEIQDIEGLTKIVNLVNGKFRSPKIEALHRLINWLNKTNPSLDIPLLGLDYSSIETNSWLAGFSDADANFATSIYLRKKSGSSVRVQQFFRLEIRQTYHRDVDRNLLGGPSYFRLLSEISSYFRVNLYSRTRNINNKIYYSFMVIAHNKDSHILVRKYFDTFPMFSSKQLNYLDWCKINDIVLSKSYKTPQDFKLCKNIKESMNNKRTYLNWDHLNYFYT